MMTDSVLRDRFFKKYHGQEIENCIQCGMCSGSCPLAPHMDFGPRQLFAMAREGDMNEVLHANTIWLCVSCYNCVVKCPRGISITDHMYSLKKMATEVGIKPPKMLHLYRSFNAPVEKNGRLTDVMAMAGYGLRHPGAAMANVPLGLKMLSRKRLELKPASVKNIDGFQRVLKKAKELERVS
ncbi:MAG: heterodisulfide reductase [Desulfobacteraceae bacterium]|nr:4Fe-4S dicluster domain-containing protein [Desulfobacteraceae bacterium]MBC2757841.1 heterodisulfide reductase [Desulfobacteraceae bacterium]